MSAATSESKLFIFFLPMLVSREIRYKVIRHLPIRKSFLSRRVTRPCDDTVNQRDCTFPFPPVGFKERGKIWPEGDINVLQVRQTCLHAWPSESKEGWKDVFLTY